VGGEYQYGHEQIFWFLMATGPHVGTDAIGGTLDTDNLHWLTGEGFAAVDPQCLIITGNLVDASNGGLIPTVQYEEEWALYRAIVNHNGMTPQIYFDLPGTHDQFNDPGFSFYRSWSVQGARTGEPYTSWRLSLPFGDYVFIGLATPTGDGLPWPFDNAGLSTNQMAFLERELQQANDARMSFVFGHHPADLLTESRAPFIKLLQDHKVALYGHGHGTDVVCDYIGGGAALHLGLPELGRTSANQIVLAAVDHDNFVYSIETVKNLPFFVLTAPVPAEMCGANPNSFRVPRDNPDNPIRLLVCDAPDQQVRVRYRIDDLPFDDMTPADERQHIFVAQFDGRALEYGPHQLDVRVQGSRTITRSWTFVLTDTQCTDGLDNDGDGLIDFADPGCADALDDSELESRPDPHVNLVINRQSFQAGDRFTLRLDVDNPGARRAVELWTALQIFDQFLFYPAWDTSPTAEQLTLTEQSGFSRILLDFQWPAGAGTGVGLTFFAALTDPGTGALVGELAQATFGYY